MVALLAAVTLRKEHSMTRITHNSRIARVALMLTAVITTAAMTGLSHGY
jgi:hypothetical protein